MIRALASLPILAVADATALASDIIASIGFAVAGRKR